MPAQPSGPTSTGVTPGRSGTIARALVLMSSANPPGAKIPGKTLAVQCMSSPARQKWQ